jgi:hypothetical protein
MDVAIAAGTSRQSVSLIEQGRLADVGGATARRIAAAVGLDLVFAVRGRGASIDRLLDEEHSALVDAVVRLLEAAGWLVVVEYSFNHFGDRGSVDVLGWHAAASALLILEVKSELTDLQATCRSIDTKRRIVPGLVSRERGWRARNLGVVIVLPDTRGQRKAVDRRASIFAAGFPWRTVEVKRWIARPAGTMSGVWFLNSAIPTGAKRQSGGQTRVRRHRPVPIGPKPSVVRASRTTTGV